MSVCDIHRAPFALKAALRWGIPVAGAVLIAAILGAPSASAAPLLPAGLLPAGAGSSPPSLPSNPLPQPVVPTAPPVQVEVPTVPPVHIEVPTAPQGPVVKTPSANVGGTTPTSPHLVPAPSGGSSQASTPDIDLPAVNEIEGGGNRSVGIATDEAPRTAASARNEGSGSRGVPPAGIRAGSLESAQVAPQLLAYIWPAIALDSGQELLRTLQAGWETVTSLSLSDVPGVGSGSLAVRGIDRVGGPFQRSALSNPSPGDSRSIRLPSGAEIPLLVFIISCAALMALLVFTLRREFRATHYRWPL